MKQGYSPENFLIFDDSALLTLYSQAAAGLGLGLPLYLLILKDAFGGMGRTLVYGMRATSAASAFLLAVHFIAANAVVRMPKLPNEKKPIAPLHAQHALSLLFTTHLVGVGRWGGLGWFRVLLRGWAGNLAQAAAQLWWKTRMEEQHMHHTHSRTNANPPTHPPAHCRCTPPRPPPSPTSTPTCWPPSRRC
jgi:hypothetical protein